MLIRYTDWKKPTDAAYAFSLREGVAPSRPPVGSRRDIRDVSRRALLPDDALRFEQQVERWSGPEDVVGAEGLKPYEVPQLEFLECGASKRLSRRDLERVLRGTALVLRPPEGECGPTDYVLRDHHMLDVVLDHYVATGELPTALFHADRHSDWCRPTYLDARRPQQAATWWALLEGLKRPGAEKRPVLRERDVFFTTAEATRQPWMAGRDVGAAAQVPGALDTDLLGWRDVLASDAPLESADWVSLDLDYFSPSPQLRLTSGLLRAPRFQSLFFAARVRVFVLSPQFLHGGERLSEWKVQGALGAMLRLLNLVRDEAALRRLGPRGS